MLQDVTTNLAGVTGGVYHFGGDGLQAAALTCRPWLRDFVPGLNAWIAKQRAEDTARVLARRPR